MKQGIHAFLGNAIERLAAVKDRQSETIQFLKEEMDGPIPADEKVGKEHGASTSLSVQMERLDILVGIIIDRQERIDSKVKELFLGAPELGNIPPTKTYSEYEDPRDEMREIIEGPRKEGASPRPTERSSAVARTDLHERIPSGEGVDIYRREPITKDEEINRMQSL